MEEHGNRNKRRAQTMHGFNDDRCFISFFGTEHFVDEIDTYQSHELNRAIQKDRSLESLGNFCICILNFVLHNEMNDIEQSYEIKFPL